MKVKELLEARNRVKGNWQIANLTGWVKTFKDEDSPEAQAWMRNRDSKSDKEAERTAKKREREAQAEARAERTAERAEKKRKADLSGKIHDVIEDAIGSAFDGVDPIDHLGPFMRRNKLDMDDIDEVANKYYKTKKGFYGVLADMWDDTQGDRMADEKAHLKKMKPGQKTILDTDSYNDQFYDVKDGKVIPKENPWK